VKSGEGDRGRRGRRKFEEEGKWEGGRRSEGGMAGRAGNGGGGGADKRFVSYDVGREGGG